MTKEQYFTRQNISSVSEELAERIRQINPNARSAMKIEGRVALLVTDMQKYFLEKSSRAYIPAADGIVPGIKKLIELFRLRKFPILFTQHYNKVDSAGMMSKWWRNILTQESKYYPLHPEIAQYIDIEVIEKQQYDVFFNTNLEKILKSNQVDQIVITGVMANLCCETTLRSAFVRGYEVCMPLDGTAAYNREAHFGTFLNLSFGFSPLITTTDLLKLIG
jgi:nicotinamidase-related amidase